MAIDPLTAAFNLGKEVVERIWPDPTQRAQHLYNLEKLKQDGDLASLQAHVQLMLAQIKVNEADAKSGSFFQAGWRPMIGWTCSAIIAFNYIGVYCLELYAAKASGSFIVPDPMDMSQLWPLMMALLGVSASRSYDKKNGTDTRGHK